MKLSRVALAAALIFGVSGFAVAQDCDHDRDDRGGWREGSNREERSEAYQDGFHEGQRDRVRNRGYKTPNHGRHWEDQAYRDAYVRGYRAGYGYGRDGDNDRDDGVAYRRNPGWENNGGWQRPGYPAPSQYPARGPVAGNQP